MVKFVVSKKSNGEYQFNLILESGKVILTSGGFTDRESCEKAIDSVRNYARDYSRYERKTSSENKSYFNLKAGNGKVIATSELYDAASGRDSGVASVNQYAPTAKIEDATV